MLCVLQEIAVKETFLEQRVRVGLHCIVGGLMYMLGRVIDVPKLQSHVETVSPAHYSILCTRTRLVLKCNMKGLLLIINYQLNSPKFSV